MILNFIFAKTPIIFLSIWFLFLVIVAIRYFRPNWVKNISYNKLIVIAIAINIFYSLFVSWGTYYVWSHGNEMMKFVLHSPITDAVPFASYLEWTKPLFSHNFGYFLYYIWGRFWFYTLISFVISGSLYVLFKIWESKRGGFSLDGPKLLLILMLISGWPGVLVSIALGFIFAVLLFGFYYLKMFIKKIPVLNIVIEPAFIFSTLIALLFTKIIVMYML